MAKQSIADILKISESMDLGKDYRQADDLLVMASKIIVAQPIDPAMDPTTNPQQPDLAQMDLQQPAQPIAPAVIPEKDDIVIENPKNPGMVQIYRPSKQQQFTLTKEQASQAGFPEAITMQEAQQQLQQRQKVAIQQSSGTSQLSTPSRKDKTDDNAAAAIFSDREMTFKLDKLADVTHLQFQQMYLKTMRAQGGGQSPLYADTKKWFDDLIQKKKGLLALTKQDLLADLKMYNTSVTDRSRTQTGEREQALGGKMINWLTGMLSGSTPAVLSSDILDATNMSPMASGGRLQGTEEWQQGVGPGSLLIGPEMSKQGLVPYTKLVPLIKMIDGSLDYTQPQLNTNGFKLLVTMFWTWKNLFRENLEEMGNKSPEEILGFAPEASSKKVIKTALGPPGARQWMEGNLSEEKLRELLGPADAWLSKQLGALPSLADIQNAQAQQQPRTGMGKIVDVFSDKDINERFLVPASQRVNMPLNTLAVEGLQYIAQQELGEREAALLFGGNVAGGAIVKIYDAIKNFFGSVFGPVRGPANSGLPQPPARTTPQTPQTP